MTEEQKAEHAALIHNFGCSDITLEQIKRLEELDAISTNTMTTDTPSSRDEEIPTPKHKTSLARLESAREWKRKNKAKVKAYTDAKNAAIRADPVAWAKKLAWGRESAKRNRDKYREYDRNRDPQKKHARATLRDHIVRGKIKRGSCEVCGAPNADAHHEDYSKPLEVRWLCRKHHKQLHQTQP